MRLLVAMRPCGIRGSDLHTGPDAVIGAEAHARELRGREAGTVSP